MQEEFLHYVWQYQKFNKFFLKTLCSKVVEVLSVGNLNTNAGPDFLNSRLFIGGQQWFGAVEIHIKSSDWFKHNHHNDNAYNIVVLHVVWENDVDVFDFSNNKLPTLELKNIVSKNLQLNYKSLFFSKKNINCGNQIVNVNDLVISFWKEKLLLKRLERKVTILREKLVILNNDWESLLYTMLLENFGLKINSFQFSLLSKNVPYSLIKKVYSSQIGVEAILFGQANLLNDDIEDIYYDNLKKEYSYLKQKYKLSNSIVKLSFFRLRPASFPTIRISQFSSLYFNNKKIFSRLMAAKSVIDIYTIFNVSTSEYWENHYVFGKKSLFVKKELSKSFINNIIINSLIPIKYAYSKSIGSENLEELLLIYETLPFEKNNITNEYKKIGLKLNNAKDSQSFIELYNSYCSLNKCLHCEIGNKILYSC